MRPTVVAVVLLSVIAVLSVWILILAWMLAAIGMVMVLAGGVWLLFEKPEAAHDQAGRPSGWLIWPGLGLVGAPFANIFVVMPVLRAFFAQ